MAEPMGFFTDTTVCIGCKACEVACKEWNQLPGTNGGVNTLERRQLRQHAPARRHPLAPRQVHRAVHGGPQGRPLAADERRLQALRPGGCLEVCPTGAIIRTEFDTVVIQSDACNGCRDCIAACPFGVIDINPVSGTAQKCTLCYDRLQGGLEPACSKACPTDSIQFGTIGELRDRAQKRVEQLHQTGEKRAYLYGADEKMLGGLNSFYLLVDKPEVYGLPPDPEDADAQSCIGLVVFRLGRRSGRPDRHLQLPQSRRRRSARRRGHECDSLRAPFSARRRTGAGSSSSTSFSAASPADAIFSPR